MAARSVLKIRFYVEIILNTECCKGSTEFPYTPHSESLVNVLHYHGAFVKTKKPLYSDSSSFTPNVLCLFQDPIQNMLLPLADLIFQIQVFNRLNSIFLDHLALEGQWANTSQTIESPLGFKHGRKESNSGQEPWSPGFSFLLCH